MIPLVIASKPTVRPTAERPRPTRQPWTPTPTRATIVTGRTHTAPLQLRLPAHPPQSIPPGPTLPSHGPPSSPPPTRPSTITPRACVAAGPSTVPSTLSFSPTPRHSRHPLAGGSLRGCSLPLICVPSGLASPLLTPTAPTKRLLLLLMGPFYRVSRPPSLVLWRSGLLWLVVVTQPIFLAALEKTLGHSAYFPGRRSPGCADGAASDMPVHAVSIRSPRTREAFPSSRRPCRPSDHWTGW